MYVDPESKRHLPQNRFMKWGKLSWSERLRAAKLCGASEGSADSAALADRLAALQNIVESNTVLHDPELQADRRRSKHYTDLVSGQLSGGLREFHFLDRARDRSLARKAREGKEISQFYQECDYCGRPCTIAGSGMCNKCRVFEREKAILGIVEDSRQPATYLSAEYSTIFRAKLDQRLNSSTVDERRRVLESSELAHRSFLPALSGSTFGGAAGGPTEGSTAAGGAQRPALSHLDPALQQLRELHALVKNNQFDSVKEMLVAVADGRQAPAALGASRPVELRDEHGNTPLIVAVQQGHKRMAKLLLAAEADVNAQNKDGNTAMHYAVMYGYQPLARYLASKGADEFITNTHGHTSAQMVRQPH